MDDMPAPRPGSAVTIRRAREEDARAVARVAALDSRRVPDGDLLVAVVDGVVVAALALEPPHAHVADPFHPTVAEVALLQTRAAQLRRASAQPRRSLQAALREAVRRGPPEKCNLARRHYGE